MCQCGRKTSAIIKIIRKELSALVQEVLWNPIAGSELWLQEDGGEVNRVFVPGFIEVFICSGSAKDHHMKSVAKIILLHKCFLACTPQSARESRTTEVQDGKDVTHCKQQFFTILSSVLCS